MTHSFHGSSAGLLTFYQYRSFQPEQVFLIFGNDYTGITSLGDSHSHLNFRKVPLTQLVRKASGLWLPSCLQNCPLGVPFLT